MITSWQKILVLAVSFVWLFGAGFSGIKPQQLQQTGARIDAYAVAVEDGEYIYLAGNAVNLAAQLPEGSLNQAGGMLDIWVAKLHKDGTPVFQALIGGSADESAYAISIRQGVMYVFGETWSDDFPGAPGNAGDNDALVLALSADGRQILWANRFGGSDQDSGRAMAIQGDALCLTGITWSNDFLPGGWKGNADGFLARVDLSGSVKWVKEFGGSALDAPFGLAARPGQVWVTGQTFSANFAGTALGNGDIFALRFDEDGTQSFAGIYGGQGEDVAYGAALASDGSLYLAGDTQSSQLPGAKGSFGGLTDSFIMRIATDGSLQMTSYLGGPGLESGSALVALPNGNVAVTGRTQSPEFLTGLPLAQPNPAGQNAYVAQVNPSGDIVSVLLTGGDHDPRGLAILPDGLALAGSFGGGIDGAFRFITSENLPGWSVPTIAPAVPTATNAPTATVRPTEMPGSSTRSAPAAATENPAIDITATPTSEASRTQAATEATPAALIQLTNTPPAESTEQGNVETVIPPTTSAPPMQPAVPAGVWLAGGAFLAAVAGGILYSALRKKK